METVRQNHYAILGLDRNCTTAQIRAAFCLLVKQHHPDVHNNSRGAVEQTQLLNAAYEILSDPIRREEYDRSLAESEKRTSQRSGKIPPIKQEIHLRLEEFLRGTTREIQINDPGNLNGIETYEIVVPPSTAPGTRLRLKRDAGGFVEIRFRPLPHFQFKPRGSDLRCDLKISSKRASQGGEEMIKNIFGSMIRVKIPARIARGEILRIDGEGLPKTNGSRGDLLVRIIYRPEVRILRKSGS